MIGKTLAHYEISALLGRGGMGEVYRARDIKLDREVALKLLPAEFAENPERIARFRQEARTLASLNHPNVASIFGLEEDEGHTFLAMELVEGEDLSTRLERGRLTIEDAIDVARQIAEGLEEAHERGIVHRDLKPANVKLTPDGKVKILDFGLARAYSGQTTDEEDLASSPTITAAMTQAGVILGTAAYMSPEQARGKPVDRRADIWAFGVILFEMLTGERLHAGETVSDTLAGVLVKEPEWTKLSPETPPYVERVLRRCLAKDPRQRLRDIGEARIRLVDHPEESGELHAVPTTAAAPARSRLPWAIAALSILVAVAAIWTSARRDPVEHQAVGPGLVRFFVPIAAPEDGGAGSPRVPGEWLDSRFLDISRDGSTLAFLVDQGGEPAIGLRPLASTPIQRLLAPEFRGQIFFSPNGNRIGYVGRDAVRAVALDGGTSNALTSSGGLARGGVWLADGRIVLPQHTDSPLSILEPREATFGTLTDLDIVAGERTHRWPEPLPDGRGFLLTVGTEDILDFDEASVAVFDGTDKSPRRLAQGTMGRYSPTGHLVYHRGGTLYAAPFDLESLSITGESVPVLAGVMHRPVTGAAQYAFSENGILCYVPGGPVTNRTSVHWAREDGSLEEVIQYRGRVQGIALSPDGRLVALEIDAANANIWILDLARGGVTRLTFEGSNNYPCWDASGKMVYYSSARDGVRSIYRRSADGGSSDELVLAGTPDQGIFGFDVAPDGTSLCLATLDPDGETDLYRLPLDGTGELEEFLVTRFREGNPSISPDSRWVAYASLETGNPEVYIRRYPEGDRKQKVSANGGRYPRWSPAGDAIYYSTEEALMRVTVQGKSDLSLGVPEEVVGRGEPGAVNRFSDEYDIAPDGQRYLMIRSEMPTELPDRIEVVLNWFEELKQKVPTR